MKKPLFLRKGEICDKNLNRSYELHQENVNNTEYIPSVFSLAEMFIEKEKEQKKNLTESARLYKICCRC